MRSRMFTPGSILERRELLDLALMGKAGVLGLLLGLIPFLIGGNRRIRKKSYAKLRKV